MEGERERRQVGYDDVLALRLQVHLEGEREEVGEVDGDEPEGDRPRHRRDQLFLTEEAEDRRGEDEYWYHEGAAHKQDYP